MLFLNGNVTSKWEYVIYQNEQYTCNMLTIYQNERYVLWYIVSIFKVCCFYIKMGICNIPK